MKLCSLDNSIRKLHRVSRYNRSTGRAVDKRVDRVIAFVCTMTLDHQISRVTVRIAFK